MARVLTRCGGISCRGQRAGAGLIVVRASLCGRDCLDPSIPAVAECCRAIALGWPGPTNRALRRSVPGPGRGLSPT